MILTKTPLRLTLSGGGTDLPSFYSKHSGMVLSMAIDKYIYITYKPDDFEKLIKLRYSKIEIVDNISELQNHRARAVLHNHGINSGEINTCADLPSNTGLGSSGSFLVGMLQCIREYKGMPHTPNILANEACHIEMIQLNEPVGKQDQFIAAYGGIKLLNIDIEGKVTVDPFQLDDDFLDNIQLYYLGIKRDASDILKEQSLLKGNSVELLQEIKHQAIKSLIYLSKKDYDSYGYLMHDYWKLKKQLSNKISLPIVDQLYDVIRKEFNVFGAKITGAGGGGFLMTYCPKYYSDNLDNYMASKNFKRLPFKISKTGSEILGNFIQK